MYIHVTVANIIFQLLPTKQLAIVILVLEIQAMTSPIEFWFARMKSKASLFLNYMIQRTPHIPLW